MKMNENLKSIFWNFFDFPACIENFDTKISLKRQNMHDVFHMMCAKSRGYETLCSIQQLWYFHPNVGSDNKYGNHIESIIAFVFGSYSIMLFFTPTRVHDIDNANNNTIN